MKKSVIIILLVVSSLIAQAQFSVITPKIGLTLSTARDLAQFDFKPGFLIGTSVAYKFSSKFSLVPGILFEQKRESTEFPFGDPNGSTFPATEKLRYNYLCLPVLLEFHPFQNNHIFINGGLYTGYLVNAKAEIIKTNSGENSNIKGDVDLRNFKRLIFGLGIGGGINIPVAKKGQILIDLQYEYTLTKGDQPMDLKFKTLTFSAGYGIRIGR